MKFFLRILLFLCILIAGTYVATPLWLPVVIAELLPAGWQLDKLDAAYWGVSGTNIHSLSVHGKLRVADIEVTASDIRFDYRGFKTEIGSLLLNVHMLAVDDRKADVITLDDLSLPITELTGEMPELSVLKIRLALHHNMLLVNTNPLVLNFQSLQLTPREDSSFHLVTDINVAGGPGLNGRIDIDVNADSRVGNIRFPAAASLPAWLTVAITQRRQLPHTTTRIQAAFYAAAADQEWLDSILVHNTNGRLTHVGGTLTAMADFAGKDLQAINQLSLTAEQWQADFDGGSLNIDGALLAVREDEKITIALPAPAAIQLQDRSGRMYELSMQAVPGLQRFSQPVTTVLAEIGAGSSLVVQTGQAQSMEINGDVKLGMTSATSSISMRSTDLQVGIEDFSRLNVTTAGGMLAFDWIENAPFSYLSDDLGLAADKLSFTSVGHVQLTDQTVVFESAQVFNLQLEGLQAKLQSGTPAEPAWLGLHSAHYAMQGQLGFELSISEPNAPVNFHFDGPVAATEFVLSLAGDENSPATMVTADEMSIVAGLTAHSGKLISTGNGTFVAGQLSPLAASAGQIDITWQDLDLSNLAGKLSTRTHGFAIGLEGETWTGFDVDIAYTLASSSDVRGSGTVMFDAGPEVPIIFRGNTQTEDWNVSLPGSRIELSQLGDLLAVAHVNLPESVILQDGYIEIQGDVVIGDEITASMTISGSEMGASMLPSSVRQASFSFNTTYGKTISVSGPLSIETMALAGGFDVSGIRADLQLAAADSFALKNLNADLFDGQLNLNSLRFSENRLDDMTLVMTHISLEKLLAFADVDGLVGTGYLDISLPAGSDDRGVHIKNGTFTSTAPGRLAYTMAGVAGSNIGLQAMENFQYQELSGTINYQADGAYQIGIRLEGKNPDLYGGHPIVFNLHINGSLPQLFEAMFITGNFEESILNQIRIQ